MPTARTICTSMRIADGVNASLVMTNDLATKRRAVLDRIDYLARTTCGAEQLRDAIARELAELAGTEREVLAADTRRRAAMSATVYADEAEA